MKKEVKAGSMGIPDSDKERSGTPKSMSDLDGGSAMLELARDLARQERRILLQQQQIELLEVAAKQADGRLARQRVDQDALLASMRVHVEALRCERDDLNLTARTLRAKLCTLDNHRAALQPKGARVANSHAAFHVQRSMGDLRVAGIMDEFTFSMFAPSCELCQVGVLDWQQQLAEFKPDLLFVESAWQGNQGQWARKINHPSRELRGLLEWCKKNGVATVFWNKEDPVHFTTFINTTKLFDHVFTTDLDCIGRYKSLLGHERVYLLPFCGQPLLHNPIERFERKQAFCFAGAYYVRYPERQRDFDTFISALGKIAPVEIFDRNYGKDDPNYMFPDQYRSLIQGTLAYTEIDKAYKGYAFGINLNSVKQSQTMFARRAFDLMLSNTHVVSNYSRGLRLMFGDLVTSTDSGTELIKRLGPFIDDKEAVSHRRMHRLLALRKAMLEHTVENRLAYICSKVGSRPVERDLPAVVVAAIVANDVELVRIMAAYRRQAWQRKRLVIVLQDGYVPVDLAQIHGQRDISLYTIRDAGTLMPEDACAGEVVAFFSARDFYGEHYLTDSALAFLYSRADVVGKGAWYEATENGLDLREDGRQYHWQERMPLRRAVAAAPALAGSSLLEWLQQMESRHISGEYCLALDEFGYLANAAADMCPELEEPAIDTGLPLQVILDQAEGIRGVKYELDIEHGFDAAALSALYGGDITVGALRLTLTGDGLQLRSLLGETEHKYLYASRLLKPEELVYLDEINFNLLALPGLHLDVVLVFLAADGERLGQMIKPHGRNHSHVMPDGTADIRFGLRVLGPGTTRITGLSLRHLPDEGPLVPQLGRARNLLLTNIYPSAEHLYRNGFVHRRVLGYREAGVRTDVFALNPRTPPRTYEFDGIDVGVGGADQLRSALDTNIYDSVLVHFLDPNMWLVIKDLLRNTRVVVWVHGSDIQPWHRRTFNYSGEDELSEAKAASEVRMKFWKDVFDCEHPNLHFVFVSNYLATTAMEDVGSRLADHRYDVIHNFVDNKLFAYTPKPESQRYKVLSIRPYTSRTYANDLTVQAILALRDKPYFPEMEFKLVGEGVLWDETLEPLREMKNVTIERRFLSQVEIAGMHREFGVFLCPSRMDTQGVSRDEAMSSGLVPITTEVGAIPEFVDSDCGMLASPEDGAGLARLLGDLVENPILFSRLSAAAASRVRTQSGFEQTLSAELGLIDPRDHGIATNY